mmetsp:Transcript_81393/g.228287  ORF Transcript_81393/g.228287 Transcript_81393/m.228287 type:complete len:229 (-) Transcript_81393:29-715(-)
MQGFSSTLGSVSSIVAAPARPPSRGGGSSRPPTLSAAANCAGVMQGFSSMSGSVSPMVPATWSSGIAPERGSIAHVASTVAGSPAAKPPSNGSMSPATQPEGKATVRGSLASGARGDKGDGIVATVSPRYCGASGGGASMTNSASADGTSKHCLQASPKRPLKKTPSFSVRLCTKPISAAACALSWRCCCARAPAWNIAMRSIGVRPTRAEQLAIKFEGAALDARPKL